MADVEQRAEAEAAQKGLSGQARRSYIGGVFNRIRQAHDKATTPGARGRRMFNRRERVQARLDARLAMQPHREAIDVLRRQRNERIAAHQDTTSQREDAFSKLDPLTTDIHVLHPKPEPGDIDPTRTPDPHELRALYGDAQLRTVLRIFSTKQLREMATEKMHTRGTPPRDRASLIRYIEDGTKPAKQPPAERQRQRAIADAIQHGAPDFPPGTLAAAQGKPAQPATKLPPAGSRPRKPLVPIKQLPGFQLDATRKLDPYFIREYFGAQQLPTALEVQTPKNLGEAVSVVEKKTGKRYDGSKSDRAEMYHWILANM